MNALLEQLPHKPPALLLDDVLRVDADGIRCTVAVGTAYEIEGRFPLALGLEAMAQAAAAWMLWRYPEGHAQGMLVQCRSLNLANRFAAPGAQLTALARPVSVGSATGLYQFAGEVIDSSGHALVSGDFLILVQQLAQ